MKISCCELTLLLLRPPDTKSEECVTPMEWRDRPAGQALAGVLDWVLAAASGPFTTEKLPIWCRTIIAFELRMVGISLHPYMQLGKLARNQKLCHRLRDRDFPEPLPL